MLYEMMKLSLHCQNTISLSLPCTSNGCARSCVNTREIPVQDKMLQFTGWNKN
jgi:hypothetical protein